MRARTRMLGTVVVSLLLLASGSVLAAASWQRWWPACRLGDFDSPRCVEVQGDFYDFIVPSDEWIAIGNTAGLAATSLLLLAAAAAALPSVLAARLMWQTVAAGTVVGVALLLVGAQTWLSGTAGHAVAVPGIFAAMVVFAFVTPVVVFAVLVPPSGPDSRTRAVGRVLLTMALLAATPFGSLVAVSVVTGYASHDTTPWEEAVTGGCLVLAAVLVWVATWPVGASTRDQGETPGSGAAARTIGEPSSA